jgi:hypothetical protein
MPKIVHIPKIGHVEFPDEMKDEDISAAASKLHGDARNAGISKFMESDPAITGLSHAQKLKELSTIAALHEKYPRLADAVDKGMGSVTSTPTAQPTAQGDTSENKELGI